MLLTSYKILFNILLSRLSPYVDEIIGDHQLGFRRNKSTTDSQTSRNPMIQLGGKHCTIFS
jgi:hypothetical protein